MNSEQKTNVKVTETSLAHIVFKKSAHIKITQQSQRGEIAVIVLNTLTNQQFSTTPFVAKIIECFAAGSTLKQVIERNQFTQNMDSEEWLNLLSQLINSETLISPELSNDQLKFEVKNTLQREQRYRVLYKPWLIKIPLLNPNQILNTLSRHCRWLWHPATFAIWLLAILTATTTAFQNLDQLLDFWDTRFLSPRNLGIAFVAYLFLKTLHELGHGLAAKHWGAEVIDAGIIFIFFVPMPYIDVSHSSTFPSKQQRLIVSAAGMIVELFIASTALFVWQLADSVFVKEVCINIMIIGALSSVLFNANPLLKFDGHYILSDILEIANLSQRSTVALRASLLTRLFNLPTPSPAHSVKEHKILTTYGFLSLLYRLSISLVIASYIASQYLAFGLILGAWLIISQVLKPSFSLFSFILKTAREQQKLTPVATRLGVGTFLLAVIIFVVPISQSTVVQGMLLPSGKASIVSNAEGFITHIHVNEGEAVSTGDILLTIENRSVEKQLNYLANQLDEYQTLAYRYSTEDPSQADFYRQKIRALKVEQENLLEQRDSLTVRSPYTGVFLSDNLDSKSGVYIKKGEHIGVVTNNKNVEIIALANEKLIQRLDDYQDIEIWLYDGGSNIHTPQSVKKTPAALSELPNKYFSLAYGGNVELDSQHQDTLIPLRPTYQIELSGFTLNTTPKFGSRANIKFVHSRSPLAFQLGHWLIGKLDDLGISRKL